MSHSIKYIVLFSGLRNKNKKPQILFHLFPQSFLIFMEVELYKLSKQSKPCCNDKRLHCWGSWLTVPTKVSSKTLILAVLTCLI